MACLRNDDACGFNCSTSVQNHCAFCFRPFLVVHMVGAVIRFTTIAWLKSVSAVI